MENTENQSSSGRTDITFSFRMSERSRAAMEQMRIAMAELIEARGDRTVEEAIEKVRSPFWGRPPINQISAEVTAFVEAHLQTTARRVEAHLRSPNAAAALIEDIEANLQAFPESSEVTQLRERISSLKERQSQLDSTLQDAVDMLQQIRQENIQREIAEQVRLRRERFEISGQQEGTRYPVPPDVAEFRAMVERESLSDADRAAEARRFIEQAQQRQRRLRQDDEDRAAEALRFIEQAQERQRRSRTTASGKFPVKCKFCRYYNKNPDMHCAVRPSGPGDSSCTDFKSGSKLQNTRY